MKIKGIFFDLDGTLLDSVSPFLEQIEGALKELNLALPCHNFLKTVWGKPYKEMVDLITKEVGLFQADTKNYCKKLESQSIPNKLFLGVEELLQFLYDKGVVMAIISNRGSSLKSIPDELGITKYFKVIQGIRDYKFHKPDPKVFQKALKTLNGHGIIINEIISVGDALSDFTVSRDAGINFFGVTSGLITKEEFIKAGLIKTNVLQNVRELKKLFS